MLAYRLNAFGLEHLELVDAAAPPPPGPDEATVEISAISLNYRDLLVIRGLYNPRFRLPATPISDGAGIVRAVGSNVKHVRPGDRVIGNFITGWIDGPYYGRYLPTTLGMPGPGLAAELVNLPGAALVAPPKHYSLEQASTLPIAALTAWSALVTEGGLDPRRTDNDATILTLGTGGVSMFVLQFARAMGARVIATSSDDAKLERVRPLTMAGVNYRTHPDWDKRVLELTGGEGVDLTVETGGAGTLEKSLKATRAGGIVSLLGALTGLKAEITTGTILMKRLRVAGIMVDSRASLERMIAFIERNPAIEPVIDRTFAFGELREALEWMDSARHLGKITLTRG